MGKLVYFKWMVEDAKVLEENLTTEQIGELFVAVMDYLQTGTVKEVSKDIRFPYADYRNKVDRACASYEETCAKRAENGKKGGTAKARNTAKAEEPIKGKKIKPPPTRKQFHDAVNEQYRELCDDDDDKPGDYEIDSFFDKLKESDWMIGSEPIRFRADWEDAITAQLFSYHHEYYDVFSYIFSAKNGLRDDAGKSYAYDATWLFFQDYKATAGEWKQSINDFLTTYRIPPP